MKEEARKINYESMSPIVSREEEVKSQTISRISIMGHLETPMTEDQLLLTLLASMSTSGSLAYNNSTTLKLIGPLKTSELYRAVSAVIERHASLRSTVSKDKTKLITHETICEEIHFFDLSKEKDINESLEAFFHTESLNAFNVEKSLFRVNIIKTSSECHLLNITVHHIICDGVSVGIILQDIEAFYSAFAQENSIELAEPMQFPTFSNWRNSNEKTTDILKQEAYWLEKIQSLNPPIDIPTDRPRPIVKTYNGARISSEVDENLYKLLKAFSIKNKCTSFMVLFAAFNILLHRITQQERFNIGIAFAGRTLPESEGLVGYCSNIYPVQSHLDSRMDLEDYLTKLKSELLDAYDNQDYSFAKLISKAGNLRDKSRSYFFSIAFNWDKVVVPEMYGLKVEFYPQPISAAEYDIMPNIMEVNGKLIFGWDYNTDLFDQKTIEEMSKTYLNILKDILNNNANDPEKINLLTPEDYQKILFDRNDTYRDFDTSLRIHDFLKKTVQAYAANKAVVYKNVALTYGDLDKLSNQYAHTILKHLDGTKEQVKIGILDDTHLNTIPLMLGILKSGNAYVPINASFPEERIRYIVKDSEMQLIFTSRAYSSKIDKDFSGKVFKIDDSSFDLNSLDSEINSPISSTDLAYIIYTSGSTGIPKGVPIQHRSVVNLLSFMQTQLKLTEEDVVCSVANLSTDMAVPDYYLPQMVGASVVLLDKDERLEASKLMQLIKNHHVSFMQASPSLLRNLIANGWNGKEDLQIISGAEPLPTELANSLEKKCKILWNWYGPTETTVWSTFLRVEKLQKDRPIVSIGYPIDNTSVYILDKNKLPIPHQVPGDLYIAGIGLSPGYHNRPELNSKSFTKNPFSVNDHDGVIYKTGDRARFLSDGSIEYLGRSDFQVKLRGNRVELGEIEAVLRKSPLIKEAAAIIYEKTDGNILVAYIKSTSETAPDKKEIYRHLMKYLPDFMLPSYLEFIDKFIYTDNGKLDRSIFPKSFVVKEEDKVINFTKTQKDIAEIWSQVLKHRNFETTDDFFMVGGNSLLLANVYEKIMSIFESNITLGDVFKNPSIKGIADAIQQSRN